MCFFMLKWYDWLMESKCSEIVKKKVYITVYGGKLDLKSEIYISYRNSCYILNSNTFNIWFIQNGLIDGY